MTVVQAKFYRNTGALQRLNLGYIFSNKRAEIRSNTSLRSAFESEVCLLMNIHKRGLLLAYYNPFPLKTYELINCPPNRQ